MSIVLDGSITIAWCVLDERTAAVLAVLDRVVTESGVVPTIWRYEVANALLIAERRRRLEASRRLTFLEELSGLDIRVDTDSDAHLWRSTIKLATRHNLTIYDASYLELAQRTRSTLATLDTALAKAAATEGIELA